MQGLPLTGLGVGITLWKPPDTLSGGGPPPEPGGGSLLQEDGVTNFVLQESDGSNITLEA